MLQVIAPAASPSCAFPRGARARDTRGALKGIPGDAGRCRRGAGTQHWLWASPGSHCTAAVPKLARVKACTAALTLVRLGKYFPTCKASLQQIPKLVAPAPAHAINKC